MSSISRRPEHYVGRHRAPARRPVAARSAAFVLGVTVAATGALGTSPANAADAAVELTGLPVYQPALTGWHDRHQARDCLAGDDDCVAVTIDKMDALLSSLAAACDNRAPFTLAYLRTTQEYQRVAAEPGFFQDPRFVNVEDVFFASYFFDAFDNWNSGNTAAVPRAWQIAFTAAQDKSMSGLGDILLGMNAHINRDLPYVLAALGLVAPDGTSRQADHLKVNLFLDWVAASMLDEAAARFDPTVNNLDSPFGISYDAFMTIIAGWRENAWVNARLLVSAQTPAQRALVERTIETQAVVGARSIQTTFAYLPAMRTMRADYCAANHG